MNKFYAEVEFKNEKNVEYLLKAFFREFNSESSILIKGKEGKMEILFQDPPTEIINAISWCNLLEFKYGNKLQEQEKGEMENNSKGSENPAKKRIESSSELSGEGEGSNNCKQISEETKSTSKNKRKCLKETSPYWIEISELKEFAEQATSFENFVELIAVWLAMDTKIDLFKNLVKVSMETEKITWNDLETALRKNNIHFTQYNGSLSS